jgi:hypothetical protein
MNSVRQSIAELGKTDLFFLCKEILGYDKMVERVHRPVCSNYVKKRPGTPLVLQDTIKNRLLLDGRGHYKSSINMGDKIQWMLIDPNVQIILLSGSQPRTKEMISEMKIHFLQNEKFREVYPEFVPPDGLQDWGNTSGFTTPARTIARRSPTITIGTIGTVKASAHYDLRDGDDVVNEINSRTREGCQETIRSWNHTRPLLNPGGYTHLTGTCYDFSDLYSQTIERGQAVWKIFRRAAWTVDESGKRVVTFPEQFCTDDDPDPAKANLDDIRREIGEVMFAAQYLNDPIATIEPRFPLDLLMQQTISRRQMPADMAMFLVFDLASTANDDSDETTGIFGGWGRDGSLFVFDGFFGIWNASQIIQAVIGGAKKWSINRVGIEDAVGVQLIEPGLYAKMKELGINLQVDWLKVPRIKGRKEIAISSLEALLVQKKLWFASEMTILPHLYTQFTRFPKYKQDGIPDAITLLQHYRGLAPANRFVDTVVPAEIVGAAGYSPFSDLGDGPSPDGDYEGLSGGLVG